MERTFKPLVLVLLVAVLALQAYSLFTPPKVSEECQAALDYAERVSNAINDLMLSSLSAYESAVYQRADNINQQQFLAIEETYIIQQSAARIQMAQLRVLSACQ